MTTALLKEAAEALDDVIGTLAMLTEPNSITATTSAVAYANCIQSSAIARATLAKIEAALKEEGNE